MKRFLFVGLLLLTSCYEHIPNGVIAQNIAERYLDSIYRPNLVTEKIGVGYITLKEYLTPLTQRKFQQDTYHYHVSKIDWGDFTKKTDDILSKGRGRNKGVITVENYRDNGTEYTTAFFVDSSFKKVFATIQIN